MTDNKTIPVAVHSVGTSTDFRRQSSPAGVPLPARRHDQQPNEQSDKESLSDSARILTENNVDLPKSVVHSHADRVEFQIAFLLYPNENLLMSGLFLRASSSLDVRFGCGFTGGAETGIKIFTGMRFIDLSIHIDRVRRPVVGSEMHHESLPPLMYKTMLSILRQTHRRVTPPEAISIELGEISSVLGISFERLFEEVLNIVMAVDYQHQIATRSPYGSPAPQDLFARLDPNDESNRPPAQQNLTASISII